MSSLITSTGILSCAAYVPRWRLSRELIFAASGWANGMGKASPGRRSFAQWDEDSITMAVEATRNAQTALNDGVTMAGLGSISLCSTSLPFADRSNAGLLREALNLNSEISLSDISGSRKSAVGQLLEMSKQNKGTQLLCASDSVDTLPASEAEQANGHGAAALIFGEGQPIANVIGGISWQQDFVDQYRMSDQRFSYQLESRWTRDAGTRPQFAALVKKVLDQSGEQASSVRWLLAPVDASLNRSLLKDCGLDQARTAEQLMLSVGNCGAAHPLLMLAWSLEQANSGDLILLAGLGQGIDLLLLRVNRPMQSSPVTLDQQLQTAREETNYTRYLGIRRLLPMDTGIRSERDNRTSMSAYFRRHEDINGFNGGLCAACGKLQFPRSPLCVHCHASNTQSPQPMADMVGEINSFTEDWLAYSPKPPLMFGNVHFAGGANVMMEFSDFLPGELAAGMPVRMSFRIKDLDTRRNFRRYFWKPTPVAGKQEHE